MGGFGGGASMRDRPAAVTTCRPLTDPSLQPRVASTQATKAVISRATPDRSEHQQGQPDHQSEQHAGGRDDRGGEDLTRRGVAEEEHRMLETPVDQAAADAAQHVADGRPEQQADDRGVRIAVDLWRRSRTRPRSRPGRRAGGSLRRRSGRLRAIRVWGVTSSDGPL